MNDKRYHQILEFFGRAKLPPNHPLRQLYVRWLLSHADDAELDDQLQTRWRQALAGAEAPSAKSAALPRKQIRLKPVLRYAAVAAMLVLSFGLGYTLRPSDTIDAADEVLLSCADDASRFELPDGSVVWLNGGSELAYDDRFGLDERCVRVSGEVFFEVKKDAHRPFRVSTATGMHVTVTGTEFDVLAPAGASTAEVVLRSGSVNVNIDGSKLTRKLKPDERLIFDNERHATTIEHVDARNYCQWFEPSIFISDAPVKDVVLNLERRYRTRISIASSVATGKRLTLTIADQPFAELVEILASILECSYTISPEAVTLY
jgi:ferric-dicitrate binding protein FerR (iron transport regulator)